MLPKQFYHETMINLCSFTRFQNNISVYIQNQLPLMSNSQGPPEFNLTKKMSLSPKLENLSSLTPRTVSAGEYSKNKIAELQDQVAKLRKQMAQRECIWGKEKNQLLNKAEILNLENVEIKQRLAQLLKVNQTMEIALGSREQAENRTTRKDDQQLKTIQQELLEKNRNIKQMKKIIEQLKKKIINMEDDKNRALEVKDQKINAITIANKQLMMDQQAQLATIKNQLASLPFNREVVAAIMRIFNGSGDSSQLTYEDLEDQYSQSPATKRYNDNKEWSRNMRHNDNSFSRISSHSIISQLNINPLPSEYSEEEEIEKLLCEVCKKVFEEKEFINHMDDCNKMKLLQNRQRLEKDLRDLDQEHRKSLSQLKRKPTKEFDNPLRDLSINTNVNTNSVTKLQRKISKIGKEPQERPGNFSQLIANDYRSAKFY